MAFSERLASHAPAPEVVDCDPDDTAVLLYIRHDRSAQGAEPPM